MVHEVEVDAQLRRIFESPAFSTSARSRQFLEFCVERAIRGEASQLKETTIAVEVFLRSPGYDPKIDPIVRVHARRVRDKLDLYYRDFGEDDPIKIDLPKGGYVPQILRTLPRRKTDFSDWPLPQTANHGGNVETASIFSASPFHGRSVSIPSASSREAYQQLRWIVTTVAILAILGMFFAWTSRNKQQLGAVATLSPLRPVDIGTDRATDFAWSPDGRQLAFAVTEKGNRTRIYIKDVSGEGRPVALTESDTGDEMHPVWSPDGREITFARRTDLSHIEIVRFNLASKKQNSVGRFLNRLALYRDSPALDLSPDGRYMVTSEQTAPANPVRLVLVSLATGERTVLTSPPTSSTGDLEARFSPDSQWVAFHRGGLGDLYLVSIRGEQSQAAVRLTFDNRGVRGIAWVNQGQSILFGTRNAKTSTFGLAEIRRSGGIPQALGPQDFDAVGPAISAPGSLALEHREIVSSLVEHTLAHTQERTLVSSNSNNASPMYSPSGRSVVYTSTRSGCMELWLLENNKPVSRQITRFQCTGLIMEPSWAPDGRSIVFSLRENGATNLFVYEIASQSLKQITATRSRDISPAYSADGKYLYYSSNDDGTSRIWRTHTDGASRAEPMFFEAVSGFQPSPDGRWLYFLRDGEDNLTLLRKKLEDGTTEEVFHVSGRATFLNGFVFAGGNIFLPVSQADLATSEVYKIDANTQKARIALRLNELAPLSESGLPGFSVSPDGSKLIAAHADSYKTLLYTAKINY